MDLIEDTSACRHPDRIVDTILSRNERENPIFQHHSCVLFGDSVYLNAAIVLHSHADTMIVPRSMERESVKPAEFLMDRSLSRKYLL